MRARSGMPATFDAYKVLCSSGEKFIALLSFLTDGNFCDLFSFLETLMFNYDFDCISSNYINKLFGKIRFC